MNFPFKFNVLSHRNAVPLLKTPFTQKPYPIFHPKHNAHKIASSRFHSVRNVPFIYQSRLTFNTDLNVASSLKPIPQRHIQTTYNFYTSLSGGGPCWYNSHFAPAVTYPISNETICSSIVVRLSPSDNDN